LNTASSSDATVAGGFSNTASGPGAAIGGGALNIATHGGTVGGGENNTASYFYSTVGGGWGNTSSSDATTVGGGEGNTALGQYSTVAGGVSNTASNSFATVGGGYLNTAAGDGSSIAGGWTNVASDSYATVGGGQNNTASKEYTTIGGGGNNIASQFASTIGGGLQNTASGVYATIVGGMQAVADRYGMQAYSAGRFAANGDAQISTFVLRTTTSNNVATTLSLNGADYFSENRTGSRTLASFGLTSASDPLSAVPISDGWVKINGTEIYVDVAGIDGNGGDTVSDLVNRINLSSYAPGSEVTATVVGDSIVLNTPNSLTGIIIGEPTEFGPQNGYSNFFHVFGLTKDASEDYQGITSSDRAIISYATVYERLTVSNNKTLAFTATICGTREGLADQSMFVRRGIIKNVAGTTTIVGSVQTIGTDITAAGTSVAVTADASNNALQINVVGVTSQNWRWVARVEAVEIGY
jgi:hypothetical protein